MSSKGAQGRARSGLRHVRESLDLLDHVHDELSQFITYSKGKDRIMLKMRGVDVKDLVEHLNSLLESVVHEWEQLQRTDREAVAEWCTMVGSLMRVLVNLSFLFDAAKYPEHKSLPINFIQHVALSKRIVHVCMKWAVEIPKQDLTLNDSVATLTNLITLLHNYVSYEFGDDHKPFCSLLVSHGNIQDFLGQTVEVFVSDAGTDFSLRCTIQQVSVEFWNAIVNWNILDENQFDAIREIFVKHSKLKGLVSSLVRRIEERDEEAIYFLALLFNAESFVSRFLTEFDDVQCLASIFGCLTGLLTELEFAENPQILLLETLVSLANTAQGRERLLLDSGKPLFELIGLFARKFDGIVEQVGTKHRRVEDRSAAENVRKCLGLFFRLYGIMHQGDCRFTTYLVDHFSSDRAANKLRDHLRHFQSSKLLEDNEVVDAEDIERFEILMRAACPDTQDENGVRSGGPSAAHETTTVSVHATAGSDAAALQQSKRQRSEGERAEEHIGSGTPRKGRQASGEDGAERLSSSFDRSKEDLDGDGVGGGALHSSGGQKGSPVKRQKVAKSIYVPASARSEDQGADEGMLPEANKAEALPQDDKSLAEALLGLLDRGDELNGAEQESVKPGARRKQGSTAVGETASSGKPAKSVKSGARQKRGDSDEQVAHDSESRSADEDASGRSGGAGSSEPRKRGRPSMQSGDGAQGRREAAVQKRVSRAQAFKREDDATGRGKRVKKANVAYMFSYSDKDEDDLQEDESEEEESEIEADIKVDGKHARHPVRPKGKLRGGVRQSEETEDSEDEDGGGAHTKAEGHQSARRPQVDRKRIRRAEGARLGNASKSRADAISPSSGDESSDSGHSARKHGVSQSLIRRENSTSSSKGLLLTKRGTHSSNVQVQAKKVPGAQGTMMRPSSSSRPMKVHNRSWYPSSPEFIDPEDFESDAEELKLSDSRVHLVEEASSAVQSSTQMFASQAAPKSRQLAPAAPANKEKLHPKTKQGTISTQPSAAPASSLGTEAEEEATKRMKEQKSAQAKTNQQLEATRLQKTQDAVQMQTAMLLLKQNGGRMGTSQRSYAQNISAAQHQQQGPALPMMWTLDPRFFAEQYYQNASGAPMRLAAVPSVGVADNPLRYGTSAQPVSSWSAERRGVLAESEAPDASGFRGRAVGGARTVAAGVSGVQGGAVYPQMGMGIPSTYWIPVPTPVLAKTDGPVAGSQSSGAGGTSAPLGSPTPGGAARASPGADRANATGALHSRGQVPGTVDTRAFSAILGGSYAAAPAASGGTKSASPARIATDSYGAYGNPSTGVLSRPPLGIISMGPGQIGRGRGTAFSGSAAPASSAGILSASNSAAPSNCPLLAKGNGEGSGGGGSAGSHAESESAVGRAKGEGSSSHAGAGGHVDGAGLGDGEGQSSEVAKSTEGNEQGSEESELAVKKRRGRPPKIDNRERAPAKPRGRPRKLEGPTKPRGRPRKAQSPDPAEEHAGDDDDALESSMQEGSTAPNGAGQAVSTAQRMAAVAGAASDAQAMFVGFSSTVGAPSVGTGARRHGMRIEDLTQPVMEPRATMSSSDSPMKTVTALGEKGAQRESGFVPRAPKISAPSSAFIQQYPQGSIFASFQAHAAVPPSRGEKISFFPKPGSVQATKPGRGGRSGLKRACVRHVHIAHMLNEAADQSKRAQSQSTHKNIFSRMHNFQQQFQKRAFDSTSANAACAYQPPPDASPAPSHDPVKARSVGFGVASLLSERTSEETEQETKNKPKESSQKGGRGGLITGFLLGSDSGAATAEGSGDAPNGTSRSSLTSAALGDDKAASAFTRQEQMKVSGLISHGTEQASTVVMPKQWGKPEVGQAGGKSKKQDASDRTSREREGVPVHLLLGGEDHHPSAWTFSSPRSEPRSEPVREEGQADHQSDPDASTVDSGAQRNAAAEWPAQSVVGGDASSGAADTHAQGTDSCATEVRGEDVQGVEGGGHDEGRSGRVEQQDGEESEQTAENNAQQDSADRDAAEQEGTAELSTQERDSDQTHESRVEGDGDGKAEEVTHAEESEVTPKQGSSKVPGETDSTRDAGSRFEESHCAGDGRPEDAVHVAQVPDASGAVPPGGKEGGQGGADEELRGDSVGEQAEMASVQVNPKALIDVDPSVEGAGVDGQAEVERSDAAGTAGTESGIGAHVNSNNEVEVESQVHVENAGSEQAQEAQVEKEKQPETGKAGATVTADTSDPSEAPVPQAVDAVSSGQEVQGVPAATTSTLAAHLHNEVDWEGWLGQGEDEIVRVDNPDCFDDAVDELEPLVGGW